jgi:chromosome segregation ATPase
LDGLLTDTDEKFQRLEDKLRKALEIFKRTQWEKRALQHELERLKADVKVRPKRLEVMERDLRALKREREDVRDRIEKLLEQIDALTKLDTAG